MDYDTIRALGSGLGSGAIVVLDDSVCRQVRLPHQPVLPQGIVRPVHAVP